MILISKIYYFKKLLNALLSKENGWLRNIKEIYFLITAHRKFFIYKKLFLNI